MAPTSPLWAPHNHHARARRQKRRLLPLYPFFPLQVPRSRRLRHHHPSTAICCHCLLRHVRESGPRGRGNCGCRSRQAGIVRLVSGWGVVGSAGGVEVRLWRRLRLSRGSRGWVGLGLGKLARWCSSSLQARSPAPSHSRCALVFNMIGTSTSIYLYIPALGSGRCGYGALGLLLVVVMNGLRSVVQGTTVSFSRARADARALALLRLVLLGLAARRVGEQAQPLVRDEVVGAHVDRAGADDGDEEREGVDVDGHVWGDLSAGVSVWVGYWGSPTHHEGSGVPCPRRGRQTRSACLSPGEARQRGGRSGQRCGRTS